MVVGVVVESRMRCVGVVLLIEAVRRRRLLMGAGLVGPAAVAEVGRRSKIVVVLVDWRAERCLARSHTVAEVPHRTLLHYQDLCQSHHQAEVESSHDEFLLLVPLAQRDCKPLALVLEPGLTEVIVEKLHLSMSQALEGRVAIERKLCCKIEEEIGLQ